MGGLGLRFQNHFPAGSAEDEAFAAAMPEATAPACFATRKRGQFAKFHMVGPAEEADASKSPHAPRGCAEASAWATYIWLMKGNAPASFWIRPPIHQCRGVVQCKHVMEQGVCSLSIEVSKSKWSKKLMPLFKDSNHPSCPKKEICSSKTDRQASSMQAPITSIFKGRKIFCDSGPSKPAIVQTSELGGSSEVPSWVKDPTACTMSMYL